MNLVCMNMIGMIMLINKEQFEIEKEDLLNRSIDYYNKKYDEENSIKK